MQLSSNLLQGCNNRTDLGDELGAGTENSCFIVTVNRGGKLGKGGGYSAGCGSSGVKSIHKAGLKKLRRELQT